MPKSFCLALVVIAACGAPAADPRDQRCFAPPPVPVSLDPDVRVLPPADYVAPIGTAHPFILGGHAANGRWVVGCQARVDTDGKPGIEVRRGSYMYEGDDLVPYLFRGGGAGEAIDGLITASYDDRWLVVIRDGALRLVDDVQGTERLLADAAFDVPAQLGYGNGPLATFLDDDQLVYFRYRAGVRQVVVHALATHRERILPLAVSVLEVEPPGTGGWSRVRFTRQPAALSPTDTSQRAIRWRACGGERTCNPGYTDDFVHLGWLDIASGRFDDDPSVLTHVMGAVLRRTVDRAIRLGDEIVVPARCDAHLYAIVAPPLRMFAACTRGHREDERLPLEIFGPGFHRTLADKVARSYGDDSTWVQLGPYVYVAGTSYAMHGDDLVKLSGWPRRFGDRMLLARRDGPYTVFDPATGAEHPFVIDGLAGKVRLGGHLAGSPHLAEIDGHVIDVAHLAVIGELHEDRIAIDRDARSLISDVPPGTPSYELGSEIVEGPLHWEPMRRTAL